jgi:4a-hydroxytetrahydrobiopterin dehydratase
MTVTLAEQDIVQCRKGTPALDGSTCKELLRELPQWSVVNVEGIDQLQRSFVFPDFSAALAFTNATGALAEAADHHPALTTEWGKVKVQWWTHTVRGLHRNDFVMAARCDRLYAAIAER